MKVYAIQKGSKYVAYGDRKIYYKANFTFGNLNNAELFKSKKDAIYYCQDYNGEKIVEIEINKIKK